MTDQFEHQHPRGDAGRFAEKDQADPGNDVLGDPEWDAALVRGATTYMTKLAGMYTPEVLAAAIAALPDDTATKVGLALNEQVPGLFYDMSRAAGVHGIWWSGGETEDHVEDWIDSQFELTDDEKAQVVDEVNEQLCDPNAFGDRLWGQMRGEIDHVISRVMHDRFSDRMPEEM